MEELHLWRLSQSSAPRKCRFHLGFGLGSLSNLKALTPWDNELSGEIPPELGNLKNLVKLRLPINELSGEIPADLGILSNLELLELDDNDLSGCVPGSLEDQLRSASDLGGLPSC